MKPILTSVLLIGLLDASLTGIAHNNPGAEQAAATNPTTTSTTATNAPDAAVTNAPAAGAQTPGVTTPQPGAVLPIVVMDEAKLTDAIRSLARSAGLNYMLDPKIGFGQVDAQGRLIAEPTVTIRWENVTAEQALLALLNNYNLQLVEDPKSRIARITVKDPLAPPPLTTRIVQLQYASPTNVLTAVQSTLVDKRSKVVADVRTSQLVVLATEEELAAIDQVVERLDAPTKQVLIEARLLEMSLNPTTSKGIDWSGTLQAQHFSWGNGNMSGSSSTSIPGASTTTTLPGGRTITTSAGSTTATTLNSLIGDGGLGFNTVSGLSPAMGFLTADGVKAVLSFLNKEADAKTISAPRTVTLDNETAKIEVTRANPIINVSAGTANTSGGSTILYTNLGVILHVTPRISANNYINLKVIPEVSRVFETQHRQVGAVAGVGGAATPQTFDVDVYDIRKMETRVMIPSGNTLVLGGLIQDDVRNQNTKVPFLGDLPVLGYAFRSDAKQRQKGNLIIFITPTIVQEDDFVPTKTDFLKTPMPTSDYLEPEWTAFDSGKQLDWSKPVFEKEPANVTRDPVKMNP